MKTGWLSFALLILAGNSWAQVGELYNADVYEKTSISNPSKAIKAAEGHWLAFNVPALEGARSPCCWKGKWHGMGEAGCSLEGGHHSYGTRSDSPLAENLLVFGKVRDGRVHRLRVVGESCPVDADGARVTWVGSVDEDAGLDWLESVARMDEDDSVAGLALFAFALHRSEEAGQRLYQLAKEKDGDLSQEAIFWLGDSRGERGFGYLKQLLAELPRGDRRREINFALAQNNSPGAAELLFEICRSDPDPEQRSGAMFWLAQEYPHKAKGWLLEVIGTEQDEDVLEQAVFAISQLPADSGTQILLDIARDDKAPRQVRRQALFWLAQSDDDRTIAALTELLTR